jgi:hypothetical protein
MIRCDPTELRPVCPSSYPINDCGRPQPPPGEYVDVHAVLQLALVLPANTTIPNARRKVFEDFPFLLVSMSVKTPTVDDVATDYYYKVQYPDGRYSSNIRQSVSLTAGIGNRRRNFYPGELYPAGDFIPVELENRTNDDITVCIWFEGWKRIYLR